jgi:uncharacterized membrane protein YcaP (DUF421 family)
VIADLFEVHVSMAELVLRGSLVYWLLFLIFRFVLRRDVGAVGIADILTLVQSGGPQRRNMRRQFITMDELNEKLRASRASRKWPKSKRPISKAMARSA